MASRKGERTAAVTAAYIGAAGLILAAALTALFNPAGQKFVDWLWRRVAGGQQPTVPAKPETLRTDESLKAEGCSSPKNGECFACEKPIAFSNDSAGIVIDRLECAHMSEDHDIRAVFDGYVVTNHPQIAGNAFNTDVHLAIGFTDSPRVLQRRIALTEWTLSRSRLPSERRTVRPLKRSLSSLHANQEVPPIHAQPTYVRQRSESRLCLPN